jgi:hypothetical protein
MPIDGRSPLGEQLNTNEGLDLSRLDEDAGRLIADRMADKGVTREEAVSSLVRLGGQILDETAVVLDVELIYRGHPEVREAVADRQEAAKAKAKAEHREVKEMSVGRAITVLIVRGASSVVEQAKQKRESQPSPRPSTRHEDDEALVDIVDDIITGGAEKMRDIFGYRRRRRSR